jgi:hypothetical protein
MQAVIDRIVAYLRKLESFIVERRLWMLGLLGLFLSLSGYFGVDEATRQALNLVFGEIFDSSTALIGALTALVIAVGKLLVIVWPVVEYIRSMAVRPPSGVEAFLPRR